MPGDVKITQERVYSPKEGYVSATFILAMMLSVVGAQENTNEPISDTVTLEWNSRQVRLKDYMGRKQELLAALGIPCASS